MAQEGSWGSRLLIIAFGSAIVALGAHELQGTIGSRFAKKRSRPAALSDLHGSNPIERAQLRPSSVSSPSRSSDSLSRKDRRELDSLIDAVAR